MSSIMALSAISFLNHRSTTPPPPPIMANTTPEKKSPSTSSSPSPKSPRHSTHKFWSQEQQRKALLGHLTKWSCNHDSSSHFHGKISLLPISPNPGEELELGKPVKCILTNTMNTNSRKAITIRLFPPHEKTSVARKRSSGHMEPKSAEFQHGLDSTFGSTLISQTSKGPINKASNERYTLVVRCGAGWMSAREYFNKEYFARRKTETTPSCDVTTKTKPQAALQMPLADKDSITIRPLFHPFLRLPLELRQMILGQATGLHGVYAPCQETPLSHSGTQLVNMFGVSKSMNEHFMPWVYHTTDFEFALTGFTNFLWQSGPERRQHIKRVTLKFSHLALLHCIRWFAPDPVFSLLEPPVATHPPALQYFWRCQIQELVREVNLVTLTVDLKEIPTVDIPMVVRIFRGMFGSIRRIRFIDCTNGETEVKLDDQRLAGLQEKTSWREMCRGFFKRHGREHYYVKWSMFSTSTESLEKEMDKDKKFFDGSAYRSDE